MAVNIRNDRPHEVSFSEHLGGAVSKKNVVKPGDAGQVPAEELRFESAPVPTDNRVRPDAVADRSDPVFAQDGGAGVDSRLRVPDAATDEAHVEFAAAATGSGQVLNVDADAAAERNVVYTQADGLHEERRLDAGADAKHRVRVDGGAENAHRLHADTVADEAHREAIDGAAGQPAHVVVVDAGEASEKNMVVAPRAPSGPHIEFVPPPDEPVVAAVADDLATVERAAPRVAKAAAPKSVARAAPRSAFAGISVAVSAELRERVGTLRGETDDLVRKLDGMEQRLNRKPGAGRT